MSAEAPRNTWQLAEAVLRDSGQRQRLLAFARGRFGISAADAEDLVQDTALELLRHQALVQSAEGFVFCVFRARCIRFAASRRRRLEKASLSALHDPAPSGREEDTDRRVALRQALRGISSSCRRILSAYYVEGRSLGEAARSAELAASGAYRTINRCLQRLRACLT